MSERNQPSNGNQSEAPAVTVTDPDDFNRVQRFKEIHRARQNVARAFKRNPEPSPRPGFRDTPDNSSERVAQAVSLYVLELEPLYREAVDQGALPDEMGRFADEYYEGEYEFESVFDFAYRLGTTGGGPVSKQTSMQIFRKANDIMRRLGLELEIGESQNNDAGFDYSDILEEGPPEGDAPQIENNDNPTNPGGGDG